MSDKKIEAMQPVIDPVLQLVDSWLADANEQEGKDYLEALIGALDVRLENIVADLTSARKT